jgi:adenylate kinase family enzyme
MHRINVVGTSCSGKTTVARTLAGLFGVPHIELDALFWGPGWRPVPPDVFRDRVARAVAGERWVLDGGYSTVRDLTWSRVDTIVWLDYPLPLVLSRYLRRTVSRIRSGEEFWSGTGNRETLRHVFARDSLAWWIISTHRSRRRRMATALADRPDIAAIRLRSPRETRRWLAGMAAAPR